MNKTKKVLDICIDFISEGYIEFTTTNKVKKNYGIDLSIKKENQIFEWRMITLLENRDPDSGIKVLLINEEWLKRKNTSLIEIKVVLYHEIGHFLFPSKSRSKREENAEEFAFFVCRLKREKKVYKKLCQEVHYYKLSPLKEHRRAYNYIKTLPIKYRF